MGNIVELSPVSETGNNTQTDHQPNRLLPSSAGLLAEPPSA